MTGVSAPPLEAAGQPLVSVIVNCRNGERYLRDALDSVFAQTYARWEIVCWDNASTDATGAIARSYRDDRMRYFRGDAPVPLGHARNLAVAESRGDLLAFLDCDDLWLPRKLERQVPLFLADPSVGLVYSDTCFFNHRGAEARRFASVTPYRGRCFGRLLTDYVVSLETAMIRRAAFDGLDRGFDERFGMIEEWDLFVRIGLDWAVDFVPEVLGKWRVHASSWTWQVPDTTVLDETRAMLEGLGGMPRVRQAHAADLAEAWRQLARATAIARWRAGDGPSARRALAEGAERGLSSRLLWAASFLPYAPVHAAYRAVRPGVRPADDEPSPA